ncbi:tyrosinase family protein [Blastococcus mobilis]|nr:tyrosinase family protein [Blastococcus mobilis]
MTTRRAAWREGSAGGWDDDLVWYAAGMHRMRALTPGLDDFFEHLRTLLTGVGTSSDPVGDMIAIARQWEDPMSLGYQSQVHGTFAPKAAWPSTALWQECAHNHWFFLPWHRAYLLEFEAVVREHIRQLDGPADDWALPYWNYSDHAADPRRLGLPVPLRGDTLPDGVEVPGVEPLADGSFPNPLFIPVRLGPDEPAPGDSVAWASATRALLRPHYANQQDTARVSFGGGVIEDPTNAAQWHGESPEIGQLDMQPHGSVHNQVSGAMALFQTAGLDPAFWLHHCNVDRLWETYAHDLGHGYPFRNGVGTGTAAHASWIDRQFRFRRPDGSTGTWTAPKLLDVGALGYTYETTAPPPLPAVPPPPPPGSGEDPFGLGEPVPVPVAEAGPLSLVGEQDVVVSGGEPADQGMGVDAFPAAARWLLRFEGIRSTRPAPTSYEVFLGLEPGADAAPEDDGHYVGLLSLFGVYEASRDDGTSSGSGQRRRLDVTAQVSAQAGDLRPLATSVRLRPVNPGRDLAGAQMSIDRITLEFG